MSMKEVLTHWSENLLGRLKAEIILLHVGLYNLQQLLSLHARGPLLGVRRPTTRDVGGGAGYGGGCGCGGRHTGRRQPRGQPRGPAGHLHLLLVVVHVVLFGRAVATLAAGTTATAAAAAVDHVAPARRETGP